MSDLSPSTNQTHVDTDQYLLIREKTLQLLRYPILQLTRIENTNP